MSPRHGIWGMKSLFVARRERKKGVFGLGWGSVCIYSLLRVCVCACLFSV